MMNQPFSMNGLWMGDRQNFRMTNNNHLPEISVVNQTVNLQGTAFNSTSLGSPLQGTLPTSAGVGVGAGLGDSAGPEIAVPQVSRLNGSTETVTLPGCDFYETFVLGDNLNVTGQVAVGQVPNSCSVVLGDLCEHQGPIGGIVNTGMQGNGVPVMNQGWTNSPCQVSLPQTSVNSFTFTTPTQSYLHSPALTATTQNRFQYSRVTPQTFAPGCSAQFKHTSPCRVPRARQRTVSCPQTITMFTGSQSSAVCSVSVANHYTPGTVTYNTTYMSQPVASGSHIASRPKRRHTTDAAPADECSPPGSKIHLTEEKIARHMKELRLHNISPPPDPSMYEENAFNSDVASQGRALQGPCQEMEVLPENTAELLSMDSTSDPGSQSPEFLKHSQRQWHDFKLLEEKLDLSDEEGEEDKESTSQNLKLHFISNIKDIKSEPVIPEAILKRICNPCTQVVLWKPPGTRGMEVLADDQQQLESGSEMVDDIIIKSDMQTEADVVKEEYGMETEDEDLEL